MKIAIFPPQYFGSVGYYAAMSLFDLVVIDYDMRFDKRQKSVHRTTIADARGPLTLTMPISRPTTPPSNHLRLSDTSHQDNHLRWSDITISAHGNWWEVQRGAIESAYGRTPYFEHIIHHLLPYFTAAIPGTPLINHLASIDATIRRLAHITTPVSATLPPTLHYTGNLANPNQHTIANNRHEISDTCSDEIACASHCDIAETHSDEIANASHHEIVDLRKEDFSKYAGEAYQQIRADRLGFIPNLSILDRLFNALY